MEAMEQWLNVSDYGSDYGDGDGYGFGDIGYGSGFGYDSGDGFGSGYDSDILTFDGHKVYQIDNMPTLLYHVREQIAFGAILRDDLTLRECYIAKVGNCFAHGETARKAVRDATEKYEKSKPLDERIASFVVAFPTGVKKPASDYYHWHHILTGSCEMGRQQFCEEHRINMNDEYTPEEFIKLTKDAYGSNVIQQLEQAYRN